MNRFKHFFGQSFIGGVLVIAPVTVLLLAMGWAVNTVQALIAPLTEPLVKATNAPPLFIDFLVIILILLTCFVVGTLVATKTGSFLENYFDRHLSRFAPGYRLIRDIFRQFLGNNENSPFSRGEVAIVQLYGANSPSRATAIITSRHDNGWYTVFVPTGPNPTSGFVYHLPPECVCLRPDIKLDNAFKTIIACGAGSADLDLARSFNPSTEKLTTEAP